MAEFELRNPENVPGPFYVDDTCIDCDLCRNTAPEFFRRHERSGYTIVHRQPRSAEELALAEEALQGCPTESIGNNGEPAMAATRDHGAERS